MPGLLTPEILATIGRADPPMRVEITRREIMKYALATEQRLEKFLRGDEAPPMFVFAAFRDIVPLDELGPDGIAQSSSMPDLPLKRIMAGGFVFKYARPIRPGDVLVGTRVLVVVEPGQWQTYEVEYSPSYAGELRMPLSDIPVLPLDARKIIARRAALARDYLKGARA